MNEEDILIAHLIEEAFQKYPLQDEYPVEEAIQKIKQYRQQLNTEDRQLFDRQIRIGQHPLFAVETVEIVSGRLKPQGAQEADVARL